MILSKGKAITIGTLEELRKQAKLPTKIKATGLNGAIQANTILSSFATSTNQLSVPNEDKMKVLRELLAYESLNDLQMEPANLEQIYQHFLHLPSEDPKSKELKS